MSENLISFGKYKGQTIDVLATDKPYLEWLMAQSWFKEKHINIYQIVINNFREVRQETPEHNALQIKFLNKIYCLKLAFLINKDFFKYNSNYINECLKKEQEKHKIISAIKENNKDLLNIISLSFEQSSDVQFEIFYGIKFDYYYQPHHLKEYNLANIMEFNIEIKPTISDDFPAVLRQIKRGINFNYYQSSNKLNCLIIGEYTGVGASKEDFIKYFETEKIKVIFEKDIENLELPKYEDKFKYTLE